MIHPHDQTRFNPNLKAYAVVPGDPSTASCGGFVVGPMHAAVRAAAAGFRPYFMHGGGLCGGNQLHASGTWDNGISLRIWMRHNESMS